MHRLARSFGMEDVGLRQKLRSLVLDETSLKKTPNDHTFIKEQIFLILLWAQFFILCTPLYLLPLM